MIEQSAERLAPNAKATREPLDPELERRVAALESLAPTRGPTSMPGAGSGWRCSAWRGRRRCYSGAGSGDRGSTDVRDSGIGRRHRGLATPPTRTDLESLAARHRARDSGRGDVVLLDRRVRRLLPELLSGQPCAHGGRHDWHAVGVARGGPEPAPASASNRSPRRSRSLVQRGGRFRASCSFCRSSAGTPCF